MIIAIPKESRDHENRVAATPDTVKKFIGLGFDVTVEAGAGLASSISDKEYTDEGATIASDYGSCVGSADIVLKVQGPQASEIAAIKAGAKVVAVLNPFNEPDTIKALAAAKLETYAMEFMPRITRAQSMDVLSSQSNLAGYKSVIDAAEAYGRAMPMMMTAAGTVAPARVFIMGVGVAGLQAIATAKRLGAIVSATDVRAATKEQVESLGGKFVMVEDEESANAETEGGYAKEMSDEYKAKQAALVAETIAKQDIVITTALIPGRAAPTLVNDDMVKSMKPGSVIVDLAVEQGGNVTLSELGKVVDVNGVKILGHHNVPSRLAADASALYAKNLLTFLSTFVDGETQELNIDYDDEIIQGTLISRDGAIVNPRLTQGAA